jgi:hypothetical protein
MKTAHKKRYSPRLVPDVQPAKDPTFVRLIRDLQLAKRKMKVSSKRALAEDFERRAFQHLLNYCDAKAWVRSTEDDAWMTD